MSSDHALHILFQYKDNQKKNIWISHYTKLWQKPQNNQQKTQKLTIRNAQFYVENATKLKYIMLVKPISYQRKVCADFMQLPSFSTCPMTTSPLLLFQYKNSSGKNFSKPRKFYIRRNNNNADSIEIGCIVIAHSLPWSDLEKYMYTTLF